jgi:hypothetical protein
MEAKVFPAIVALGDGVVLNPPEVLIERDTTKSGRIEYQYIIAGGITVLFIDIKLRKRTEREKLDDYAQVFAESIGLKAYWDRSIKRSSMERKERESTKWLNAIGNADKAIAEALSAQSSYDNDNLEKAMGRAQKTLDFRMEKFSMLFQRSLE